MKEVNGIPVYEEEDICALDEYSKQLEEALTPKFQNIEDNIIESTEKILELEKESDDQKDTTELLKLQVEELKKENTQLKNQIPTGTAEGESIYLSDSSDLEAKIIVKGNSRQKTRDGSNIINIDKFANGEKIYTKNGVTLNIEEDGTIIGNGTQETSWIIFFDREIIDILEDGQTYTLWAENYVSDNLLTNSFYAQIGMNNISTGKMDYITLQTKNLTFTVDKAKYSSYRFQIQIGNSNLTLNNAKNRFMLYKGTEEKTYQPYGVMPSPEYPSIVETVGSNVNLLPNLIETQNINGIEITRNSDDSLTFNGTSTAGFNLNINYKEDNYIKFTNKSIYTISIKNNNGIYIRVAKADDSTVIAQIDTPNTQTIYTSNFDGNVYAFITILKGTTFNNLTIYPKIEPGTKATPYSPHNQGSVEIDVVNKNWIKLMNTSKSISTIDISSSNKTITVNGTTTENRNIYELFDDILLKKGTYTFHFNCQNPPSTNSCQFILCEEDGTKIVTLSAWGQSQSKIINLEKDTMVSASKSYFYVNKNFAFDNTQYELQIELGNNKSKIIEPQSQTKIVPIQEEMLEDDYIEDVEYHTWGKVVLDGTENWIIGTTKEKTQVFSLRDVNMNNIGTQPILCNYFEFINTTDDIENIKSVSGVLYIAIDKTRLISVDVSGFKAWLQEKYNSGNPVVVYYKLATPKSLPLTEEQKNILDKKTYTYKNTTNINTNSIAILDVTYKKDLETLFNQVNQGLIERS